MKKRDLKKLALIGMASGLMTASSQSLFAENTQEDSSLNQLAATKHKCGKGKCGGIIADRAAKAKKEINPNDDPNSENMGYHLMTEDELMDELNDQGQKLYRSLSPENKALARKVASQRCQAANECKGLNACQTANNACAGKGACRGKSKCAFADKNLAVKVVADKMGKKRSQASQ